MDEKEYRERIKKMQKKYGDKPYNRFAEAPSPQPKHFDPALLRRAQQRYEEYQAEMRRASRLKGELGANLALQGNKRK